MILALETGGDLASVALLEGPEVVAEQAFRHRMSLSRDLMPRVETLIGEAGAGWHSIEAVAVGLGPGSYTGLRIGVVTAKALSWASGRPVLGISSLTALVAPHLAPPETLLCAVLEARPGEFFTALYQRRGSELQIRAEPTVLRAEELAQRLSAYPGPVLVAGHAARCARALEGAAEDDSRQTDAEPGGRTAAEAAREREPEPAAVPSKLPSTVFRLPSTLSFNEFDEEPQARWIGRLADARLRAGERDDPLALVPLYVRAPAPTVAPSTRRPA
jgi:tRNA threonylcarbamoyladenosine biosynthesis protein TsaB